MIEELGKVKDFNPKDWKTAGNPRVAQQIPPITMRQVATSRVTPPLCIYFRAKPQESWTAQENLSPSMIVMTCHDDHRNWGAIDNTDEHTDVPDEVTLTIER